MSPTTAPKSQSKSQNAERPSIDLVGASDGEYDGPGGRAGERSHDGAADVARAAEEHDGLCFTECVLQWILPVTDLTSAP